MSTIVVSPQLTQDEVTSEVIQLEIFVKNEDFESAFDQLEIWRSRQTLAGPYEELTADTWRPARIPKSAGDPPSPAVTGASVNVVGLTLELKVDESKDIVVTFTGTDPITLADAASQITTQGAPDVRSYVDEDGQLVVETLDPGTGAVLRVVGGEAAPSLELPTTEPQSLAFGKDARIALTQGIEVYQFADLFGSADYFYKTRFRNHLTGAVSEFSQAFSAKQGIGVSESFLACGQLDLVHLDGKPICNQEVRLHTNFNGSIVDSKVLAGEDRIKNTDANGHVEFVLVRGQRITVAIIGTDLVRDITVPEDQNVKVFNLLDPTIAGEDVFKVQVPDLVYAERRTL